MPKTTKAERKALDAMEDAAGAAKIARKVAKDLPKGPAKELRAAAADARDVSETSGKTVRKHPQRVRRDAEKATDRVLAATDEALIVAAERSRLDARKRADEKAAKAQELAAKAERAQRRAAEAARAAAEAAAEAAIVEELVDESEDGILAEVVVYDIAAEDDPVPDVDASAAAAPGASDTSADAATAASGDPASTGDVPRGALSSSTVAQLRERARAEGRSGYSRLTKAQLIALLS